MTTTASNGKGAVAAEGNGNKAGSRAPKRGVPKPQPKLVVAAAKTKAQAVKKRTVVSQKDVPAYSLEDALRVPRAISDNYAFKAVRPIDVAAAMNLQPGSPKFKMLTGASIAYGLTEGGYAAPEIKPLPLARRIISPTQEGDDINARREALLKPRVVREFLTKYDGNKLPRQDIAKNVLEHDLGVGHDATDRTLQLILSEATAAGLIQSIKGADHVNLKGVAQQNPTTMGPAAASTDDEADDETYDEDAAERLQELPLPHSGGVGAVSRSTPAQENRRVFVTHGKNKAFIETIKELLAFGEMEPVVAMEHETVSQPVPDKVMSDMRSCSAAMIHVDAELRVVDQDGNALMMPNPNVLIEIGAAMALYGRRFILLVREGIKLPSNLQGLYEVRYTEDKLDGEATIRLLKAIKDLKNHPMPAS